jgi:methanogenic corrinoid protein MtbC1
MVADIFEMYGWDGYFVGANTPNTELLRFIESKNPDLIGLSLSIYSNLPELKNTLVKIRQYFPDLPVMVGGQAFRWGGTEIIQNFSNVAYLSSVEDLHKFINQ